MRIDDFRSYAVAFERENRTLHRAHYKQKSGIDLSIVFIQQFDSAGNKAVLQVKHIAGEESACRVEVAVVASLSTQL